MATRQDLEKFVAKVATLVHAVDYPDDAFAGKPPEWATYEEFGMHGDQCGRCGAWCSIVRPGKTQCDVCCGDDLKALAIEARRLASAIDPPSRAPAEQASRAAATATERLDLEHVERIDAAWRAFLDATVAAKADGLDVGLCSSDGRYIEFAEMETQIIRKVERKAPWS